MKRWKIAVLAVSVCLIPVAVAAWSIGSGTSTFGPLHCNTCWGQGPIPDVATDAFLRHYVNANAYQAYGKTFYKQNPGDKIIICNGEVCTTYQMTDSRDWNAIDRKSITGARPGGGNGTGGGGSGAGGYTGPIGGGSYGGGGYTGSVTVGGPTPEKPSRPTHQD
ncbi:hypothetical protein PWP89_08885 [Stenotrophomonas rhizophila]|uniref:hypothetical protein n=1 Tax=Stenotrophomonas rhizophila TaxID=216778 RepID=UPI00117D453A|nr:hypothetical protein [Stenotrophomonas rhizophila]